MPDSESPDAAASPTPPASNEPITLPARPFPDATPPLPPPAPEAAPPQPAGYHGGASPYPPPPGTSLGKQPYPGFNGYAIASFVLGICGIAPVLAILSTVFGFMSLSQLKVRDQKGRGLAIAGLCLTAVWALFFVAAIVNGVVGRLADQATSASPDTGSGGSPVLLSRLKAGDCIDDDITSGATVKRLRVVACTTAHKAEVVARFSLPPGPYPGDAEVEDQSDAGCADRMEAYAPGSTSDRNIDMSYIMPLPDHWQDAGGREVICLAMWDSPGTGSVKD